MSDDWDAWYRDGGGANRPGPGAAGDPTVRSPAGAYGSGSASGYGPRSEEHTSELQSP